MMEKSDFKRMIPDVYVQEVKMINVDPKDLPKRAQRIVNMLYTGLIALYYEFNDNTCELKLFTSKAFLAALKPGVKITNARGQEFTIESEPYIENLCMCVRANGDTWYCENLYDKTQDYTKHQHNG